MECWLLLLSIISQLWWETRFLSATCQPREGRKKWREQKRTLRLPLFLFKTRSHVAQAGLTVNDFDPPPSSPVECRIIVSAFTQWWGSNPGTYLYQLYQLYYLYLTVPRSPTPACYQVSLALWKGFCCCSGLGAKPGLWAFTQEFHH